MRGRLKNYLTEEEMEQMRIISFSWTLPALLSGAKVVTRRDWKDRYAESFKADEYLSAWDRSQRLKGSKAVAVIQLIEKPYKEATILMNQGDFYQEGLWWLACNPKLIPEPMKEMLAKDGYGKLPGAMWNWFNHWRETAGELWVIRFKVIRYLDRPVPTEVE